MKLPTIVIVALTLFIFLNLAKGAYVVRRLPEYGNNVCIMGMKEVHVELRRKFTTSRKTILKDCGIRPGPIIDCEEHIIKAVISYVPKTTTVEVRAITCCPGWKDYNFLLGCYKPSTCLSLPAYTPSHCVAKRYAKLLANQRIYKLNKPPTRPTGNPSNSQNLQNAFLFPLVNLTLAEAYQLSRSDRDELPWLLAYTHLQLESQKFLKERLQPNTYLFDEYKTTSDFHDLLQLVRNLFVKDGRYLEYFRYPSQVEKFKDITHCDRWKDDQVFVEQRLAALNPMSLQRVTADEDFVRTKVGLKLSILRGRLNPMFHWDRAISSVVGRQTTLNEMVKSNSVFAIHFPYLDQLTNVPDLTNLNIHKGRKLKKSTSPIALFVSVKTSKNKPRDLKAAAIQINNHGVSPVYTPSNGKEWLLAKQLYQVADFAYVEMIEHLLKTHMILEPICMIAKRTISEYHPLNEMLKWHCRGLITTNVNGFPKLTSPGGYMHRLFSIGHIGSAELLNKGYMDFTWNDVDFWGNIKQRGVDDQQQLPYFPYRDDGYLIWQQLQSYAEEYISLYYGKNKDVRNDLELQTFANQLSSEGTGYAGGMGQLKGFPKRFQTKATLVETFSRILWLPVQHNAVNYPIAHYGAFVPNMPTKVYDDPRGKTGEYSFYTLPESHVATIQAVISMSLGSLRIDNLLDYGDKMVDSEAAQVVNKHHRILMTKVKKIIEKRNEERFKNGHLTYPYLKPGWIPNSIHT